MARPLSQEARRKAVDAAQAIVAEHGIPGFTIDGVAKRSGVAKTTLYRHWSSANALLIHALDDMIKRVSTPNTGSIVGDLFEMLSAFQILSSDEAHCKLIADLTSASLTDPDLAAVKRSMMFERSRPLREIVSRAVSRGEIPEIDLDLAMAFIEGPVLAHMIKSNQPLDPAMIPALVNLIARGLGAD
jgi:AcrR family transcriptional regulator